MIRNKYNRIFKILVYELLSHDDLLNCIQVYFNLVILDEKVPYKLFHPLYTNKLYLKIQ